MILYREIAGIMAERRGLLMLFLFVSALPPFHNPVSASAAAGERALTFANDFPLNLDFSNSTGGKLSCSGNGNPSPTPTWILTDGSPVASVPGLRQLESDGILVFPSFRAQDFRQDVHGVTYRCAISNTLGTLVSNEIKVRGVVSQAYDIHVYDVYTIRGNIAVMRCHIPKFLERYVTVSAWILDSVVSISSSNLDSNSKYWMLPSGELFISDVDSGDSQKSYQCKATHRLTGEMKASVTSGRLIVTESQGKVPPKIVYNKNKFEVVEGEELVIPCIANGHPAPKYNWFKQSPVGKLTAIHIGGRRKIVSGFLIIAEVQESDSGTYICTATNEVNSERVTTEIVILTPLRVKISPEKIAVDNNQPATLTCKISGSPVANIVWMKDGKPLPKENIVQTSNETIHIPKMLPEMSGIYQCFASNEFFTAYGWTVVKMGDVLPVINIKFEQKVLLPGDSTTLQCSAQGNPTPRISWSLDNMDLSSNSHLQISSELISSDVTLSTLKISNVRVEDGGSYRCIVKNKAGQTEHSARINVRGKLAVRPNIKFQAIEGGFFQLDCPIYGYPIYSIRWEKDGEFVMHARHALHDNGSLTIINVERNVDSGRYKCFAEGDYNQHVQGEVEVVVLVPPKVLPFAFQDDQFFKGMRAQIICAVSQGDLPIHFQWLKDNQPIDSTMGVNVRNYDGYTNSLSIESVSSLHTGNYTCIASNQAAKATYTAQLLVQGMDLAYLFI